jgi:hypothetical protein
VLIPQIKFAPSVREIALGPRAVTILPAGYPLFVKLNGHFVIAEPACTGFHNGSSMKVSQRVNLFAYFSHQIVYYSRRPPLSSWAYKALFVKMVRNPLNRSALSLKLSGFFPQGNSVS